MGRMMVGQRKGAPTSAADDASQSDDSDNASDDSPDTDVETCPNCDCQFTDGDGDDSKPEIVKPGKPLANDTSGYKGQDLDAIDSAQPTPGKFGSAHDGALGDQVMAQLLGGMHLK